MEAALRDMWNGTETANDHINIEILKAGDDTTSKTLVKLYIKLLSERRILFKNGNKKDLTNDRPICLL